MASGERVPVQSLLPNTPIWAISLGDISLLDPAKHFRLSLTSHCVGVDPLSKII